MKKLPFAYVSDVYLNATNLVITAANSPGQRLGYGRYETVLYTVNDKYVIEDRNGRKRLFERPQDAIQKLFELWLKEDKQ